MHTKRSALQDASHFGRGGRSETVAGIELAPVQACVSVEQYRDDVLFVTRAAWGIDGGGSR